MTRIEETKTEVVTAPSKSRLERTVRLNLPSTHVPLFHAWRP
jgi:hypothetical protein